METRPEVQDQEQETKTWPKVVIIVSGWNGWREGKGKCYNEKEVQHGEKRTTG